MFFNPFILADKVLVGTEQLDGTQIVAMTIIGLLVVFCALLILVLFLNVSGSIFKKAGQKPKAKPAEKKQPAPVKSTPAKAAPPKPAAKPAAPAASSEDEEVIAVIMAAIAAMSEADGKQYQIRSVKQVTRSSGRSAWAQAGRISATQPF